MRNKLEESNLKINWMAEKKEKFKLLYFDL